MSTSSTTPPPKKRRAGKIIGLICAAFVLLLVIAYFVATSSAFFKGVILPQVGRSMNADITVADASISPFSKIILTRLEVKPHGKEPLFKADEILARYSLRDLIGGKITVDEISVTTPVITVVQAADGSSNLDPLTESSKKSKKKPEHDQSEKPLRLNLKNVSLKNALVRQTKNLSGGGREVTELFNVNISLDQLVNGASGKLNLSADLRMDNTGGSTTNAAPGSLAGKLAGAFNYKLAANALPESATGNLRMDVSSATGGMADLQNLAAVINADLTPGEMRDVSLRFEQAERRLGEVRVSGPFSAANLEGKLKVEVSSLDRRVLNLAGASSGMDFNSTTITSTNEIVLTQKGNSISISGQLLANQLSLTKKETKETTPVLNLQAAYQLSADQTAKSAVIQSLTVDGTQNGAKFLGVSLSQPMPISWGGTASTAGDATLKVALTDLNLADWKAFAADLAPSGKLSATLDVTSQQAGKQLALTLISQVENFSATLGSNQISQANVMMRAKAEVSEMKKISLSGYELQLSQGGPPALTLSGSGTVNLENKDADLKTSLQGSIAPLLKILVMPDAAVTAGELKFDGHITQNGDAQSVAGNFAVTNLKGTNATPPLSAQIDLDATARKQLYDLKKCQVTLSPTARAKNQLNVTGQIDLSKTKAARGKILAQADALDVTPFYDLYAKPAQLEASATSTPGGGAPQLPANSEPEPMKLPVEEFVATINIGQLFLREVEIKDWRGTAKIQGSRVLLDPFQLSLNGAPVKVKADLNLGVKGYAYDFSASLERVPLAPLVNTFMPENAGAYQGTLIASANVKGAGTTGVNLKKSLNGQADFTLTNANVKIVGKYLKPILSGIAFVLRAPELTTSPVKWMVTNLKFGGGKIDVANLQLQSDLFAADLKGQIPIADVLTNSPLGKIPVNFGLSYNLSRKLLLTTPSTPTNSAYVMLPGFLSLAGRLGEPKPQYNMAKIAGTILERVGDRIPVVGEKAGSVLKGLGGVFSGTPAATNAPAVTTNASGVVATNPPATNQAAPLKNVLDLFKKKKK